MKTKRNGEIDFLRFVFALIVLFFHFGSNYSLAFFPNGYIGVEFFFLVSGFLMAKHAKQHSIQNFDEIGNETWRYLLRRLNSIYPYYISVVILQLIIRYIVVQHVEASKLVKWLLGSLPTFSLSFLGLNNNAVYLYVGNTWYLSALLIAILILYPFLLKQFTFSVKVIFPLISLFSLGYIQMTKQSLSVWDDWTGIVCYGILRSTGEMSFGACLFEVSSYLKGRVQINGWVGKAFITIWKVFCYSVIVAFAYGKMFDIQLHGDLGIHAFLFCALGVLLSFSSLGFCIPDCRLSRYLGRISLGIFIFHGFIRWTLWDCIGNADIPIRQFVLLVATGIAGSVALMYLVDALFGAIKRIRK